MWWMSTNSPRRMSSAPTSKNPQKRDESFSDADRGVLIIIALVATPVVIAATLVIGLST